jgi:hypothetical protein
MLDKPDPVVFGVQLWAVDPSSFTNDQLIYHIKIFNVKTVGNKKIKQKKNNVKNTSTSKLFRGFGPVPRKLLGFDNKYREIYYSMTEVEVIAENSRRNFRFVFALGSSAILAVILGKLVRNSKISVDPCPPIGVVIDRPGIGPSSRPTAWGLS